MRWVAGLSASSWLLLATLMVPLGSEPCGDRDGDGFHVEPECGGPLDCNDGDPAIHPFAIETCNGLDDDCNGLLDDDPACVQVCTAPDAGPDFRVDGVVDAPLTATFAWTGTEYGVAWTARDLPDELLYFSRLHRTGANIGEPLVLRRHPGNLRGPSLVWTGSEFGLSWWDDSAGNAEIWFARIDGEGVPLGDPVRLSDDPGASRWPSLVWTGQGYAVAWFDNRGEGEEIYLARVDADGVEIGDEVPLTADGAATYPMLVWSGDGFGLAYTLAGVAPQKRFMLLDAAGAPLGEPATVAPGLVGDLTWTGEFYALAGPDAPTGLRLLYLSRLDANGSVLGAPVPLTPNGVEGSLPSLAWNGTEFGVVWVDRFGVVVFARTLDVGLPLGDELPVSPTAPAARQPSVVWNGAEYGVLWLLGDGLFFDRVQCTCRDDDLDGFDSCTDCDDTDPTTHPDAAEVYCDGVDNDCNPATVDNVDGDGDGFACSDDCEPNDPDAYPGAAEVGCDGIDNDCDPSTGEILDADADGVTCDLDCDDSKPTTYPGAPQLCNGVNDDCSDPGWPAVPAAEINADGDPLATCEGDCDDSDPLIYPGLIERSCDGRDNDCNPSTPDVFDADGDGFACDVDCDDGDPGASPAGIEVTCDGRDNDCDPSTPELVDLDADGFRCDVDCDDLVAEINPDGIEICDEVDNDCDGVVDFPLTDEKRINGFARKPEQLTTIWAGDHFGALWVHAGHPHGDVQLGRYDAAGNEVYPPLQLADFSCCEARDPALAWTGTEWAVVLLENDEVTLFRVPAQSAIPTGDPVVLSGTTDAHWPSIVWTGNEFGVAFVEGYSSQQARLVFRRVSATGEALSRATLVDGDVTVHYRSFALVWNGEGFGLILGRGDRTWLFELDALGQPLGPEIEILPERVGLVSLTWTGTAYGLVYNDYGAHVARVQRDGTVTSRIVTDTGANSAVWIDTEVGLVLRRRPEAIYNLFFLRVDPNGVILEPEQQITNHDDFNSGDTSVHWNGFEYGVAWQYRNALYYSTIGCGCLDEDADGWLHCNDCSDVDPAVFPGAAEVCNGIDDDCDRSIDEDEAGVDGDLDGVAGACDNCPDTANPGQTDLDADLLGNACDTDDGLIYVRFPLPDRIEWDVETGFDSWNLYVGDLATLVETGSYTQAPGSNPLAGSACALPAHQAETSIVPGAGEIAFYLVTGVGPGGESGLGMDSTGVPRAHDHPCDEGDAEH